MKKLIGTRKLESRDKTYCILLIGIYPYTSSNLKIYYTVENPFTAMFKYAVDIIRVPSYPRNGYVVK